MTSMPVDDETQRRLAVSLYNHVWDLLETADRTPVMDEDLVHAAHASRWHWGVIGGPEQRIVGDWQVSRAYAAVGRGRPAVHYAGLACAGCEAYDDAPAWLPASTSEGMARALLADGDTVGARQWAQTARSQLDAVDAGEDRELVSGQLDELALDEG